MEFHIHSLPTFVTEAAKLTTARAKEPFGKLTISEAELVLKTWVYEAMLNLQTPEETSLVYYTRKQASSKLGISAGTLDAWEKQGLLKYRWIGNRKILLDTDLNALIRDDNIYNSKK